jgi:hypothetical protein
MATDGLDSMAGTAERYREFAREAHGRSAAYEALAEAVAGDRAVLGFLAALPVVKRQPNLLFAAARYLLGGPADIGTLRGLVGRDAAGLSRVMLARRTQTNEPARCATLLPALAGLPGPEGLAGPLALIEVGASAGLTLLFDRYSYDFGGRVIRGSDPEAPMLRCAVHGPVPVPAGVPDIAWRAGLDLNPLDVTSEDDMHWLSCLLWPGEGDREERLAGAVAAARRDPPAVFRGDLNTDLPALAARAPAGATLVVYHTAVLGYVAAEDRARFADTVRGLGAVWLSNEGPGVVPGATVPAREGAPFVLILDGRTPLAYTDPHGTWVHWLG